MARPLCTGGNSSKGPYTCHEKFTAASLLPDMKTVDHCKILPLLPQIFLRVAMVVALLAASSAALAQIAATSAEAPQEAAESTPAEPTVADVMTHADTIDAELGPLAQKIRRRNLAAEAAVRQIPGLVEEYNRDVGLVNFSRIDEVAELELVSLGQSLKSIDRRIEASRVTLKAEVDDLMPGRIELHNAVELFERILHASRDEPLPQALRDRLERMLTTLESARAGLADRLDIVVAQLDRVITLQNRASETTDQIKQELLNRERAVLKRNSEPLWKVRYAGLPELRGLLGRNLDILSTGIRDFWQVNALACLATLVLLIVMLAWGLAYRRALLRSQPASGTQANLVRHQPVVVLTLLWLLLGPELLLPELTPGLGTMRGILVVGCLFYLLPDLVRPPAVAPMRALFGVLFLVLTHRFILIGSNFGRLLLLLLAVAGIGIFRWLELRLRGVEGGLGEGGLALAGRWLSRLAPPALAVGLIAEVLGLTSLADQLIGGTLLLGVAMVAYATADVILRYLLGLAIRGPGTRWSHAVARYPELVQQRVTLVLRGGLVLGFIALIPRLLPFMNVVFEAVNNLVSADMQIGDVSFPLLAVIAFVASVLLAIYAARFVRFILQEDIFARMPVSHGVASASSRLAYYAMVIGGLLFAFAVAGIELSKLTIIIGALGVGIGFGLQNVVNNVVSGLIIAFERPFREGDQIAIGQVSGRVQQIGLRASRVRTFEGAEMIIPNGNLISGEVTNWTLSDRLRRMQIAVSVSYGSDPRTVEEILLKIAEASSDTVHYPAPKVHFRGFGDSSLDFMLLVWTADADARLDTESALRYDIFAALAGAGIEIPFPQRDVHIRTGKVSAL